MSSSTPAANRAMRYRYAYATHRGMVREQNEDSVAIAAEHGLALIADGMGGYNAGEVASGLATDFLLKHLVDDFDRSRHRDTGRLAAPALHALLRERVDGANEAIIDAANREPNFEGMGTTLAMLVFSEDIVTTLHLGDSRIYRMRDDVLSLLTRDHSVLQEQLDAGVLTEGEARTSNSRNYVTRALGVDVVTEPEINEYDLAAGDLYLLCSDGLPDMLSDEQIFDLLRRDPGDDDVDAPDGESSIDRHVVEAPVLDEVATSLVEAANALGGRDNVSVVLASVGWEHDPSVQEDNGLHGREYGDQQRA